MPHCQFNENFGWKVEAFYSLSFDEWKDALYGIGKITSVSIPKSINRST